MQKQFMEACDLGDIRVVKELISKGYDPSANKNEGILVAYGQGHYELVGMLLSINNVEKKLSDLDFKKIKKVANEPNPGNVYDN